MECNFREKITGMQECFTSKQSCQILSGFSQPRFSFYRIEVV